uniref:uncharacterized protein LOC120344565 n=1 Tax=Styela clava TaxID=7725 RepID=UPI00193A4FDE|nr:uncharacterized protein LOC120344565 [Styela clava]
MKFYTPNMKKIININNMILQLSLLLVVSRFAASSSEKCYKMSGCRNLRGQSNHKENDVFADVNENRGSCSLCTCVKTKHFVASCMVIKVVNMTTPVRKAGLLKRVVDLLGERMSARFGNDREVELSEEEAVQVECEYETIPVYDKEKQILQFHFINYVLTTWESYCCLKTPSYGNVHPYCKVQFDHKCKAKAVLRHKPRRRCPMPLLRNLTG